MHDMTEKERQLNKGKWEEAKTKNDEAKSNEELESGDFKYIVKGPPWERRVAKVYVKKKQRLGRRMYIVTMFLMRKV